MLNLIKRFGFWLPVVALFIIIYFITERTLLFTIKDSRGFTLFLASPLIWIFNPILKSLEIETSNLIMNTYRVSTVIFWLLLGILTDWIIANNEHKMWTESKWFIVFKYIIGLLIGILLIDFLLMLQSIRH